MNLGVAHPRAGALTSYTILHSLGNNLLGACYVLSAPLGAPSLYQESKQAKPPVLLELWHKKMNMNKGGKKSSRDGDHECGVWRVVRLGLTENYLKQGSKEVKEAAMWLSGRGRSWAGEQPVRRS